MSKWRNPGLGIAPPGGPPNADCSNSLNWLFASGCWSMSPSSWAALAAAGQSSLTATPPAPSGSVLTVPPASGADAQATVDALVNQQMQNQQAVDASQVSTTVGSTVGGVISQTGDVIAAAFPWATIAMVAVVGILAFSALGAGSPRRYAS